MAPQPLNEMTPAEQAKSLGLVYGGFGGWIDPKTRVVKARTIDGKLVKVEDEDEGQDRPDLGPLILFNFDEQILGTDKDEAPRFIHKFDSVIKAILQKGADVVFIIPPATEHKVADYLRGIGVHAGPTLVPLVSDDPNKRHDFVAKKIKEGYTKIHYFDHSEVNCKAVESLEATYNKLDVRVVTHLLTKKGDQKDAA